MTENDYGLAEAKKAWLTFQSARDKFEAATLELRKRYVMFIGKNGYREDASNYKVRENMHLEALTPESFEGKLLFLDRDSIFGPEYHYVPADYFADPDKWESDYVESIVEAKAKEKRQAIRMQESRLKASKEQYKKEFPAVIPAQARDLGVGPGVKHLENVVSLLVREVIESGGETSIYSLRGIVSLISNYSEDDINTALVLAEGNKKLIVRGTSVRTPYYDSDDDEIEDEV